MTRVILAFKASVEKKAKRAKLATVGLKVTGALLVWLASVALPALLVKMA